MELNLFKDIKDIGKLSLYIITYILYNNNIL